MLAQPSHTRSRAYRIIERAHELFQRRICAIEVELAEAFHEISRLETLTNPFDSYERKAALCMAHHDRLGQDSPLRALPEDLLIRIAGEAERPPL
jgi:hypothetical protein